MPGCQNVNSTHFLSEARGIHFIQDERFLFELDEAKESTELLVIES